MRLFDMLLSGFSSWKWKKEQPVVMLLSNATQYNSTGSRCSERVLRAKIVVLKDSAIWPSFPANRHVLWINLSTDFHYPWRIIMVYDISKIWSLPSCAYRWQSQCWTCETSYEVLSGDGLKPANNTRSPGLNYPVRCVDNIFYIFSEEADIRAVCQNRFKERVRFQPSLDRKRGTFRPENGGREQSRGGDSGAGDGGVWAGRGPPEARCKGSCMTC